MLATDNYVPYEGPGCDPAAFPELGFGVHRQGEIVVPCWCGLREPSMPHLLWNYIRSKQIMLDHGASMPVNRCEERLLCKVVPDMSPPPALTDLPALPDKLIGVVRTALARASAANVMFVGASGGGSDANCAGFGCSVGLASDTDPVTCGGPVDGEDFVPFAAETVWLFLLLSAIVACIGPRTSPLCWTARASLILLTELDRLRPNVSLSGGACGCCCSRLKMLLNVLSVGFCPITRRLVGLRLWARLWMLRRRVDSTLLPMWLLRQAFWLQWISDRPVFGTTDAWRPMVGGTAHSLTPMRSG